MTTREQWISEFDYLKNNLKNVNDAINSFKRINLSNTVSPALFEAQRLQLRLEYQINQKISKAVEVGGHDFHRSHAPCGNDNLPWQLVACGEVTNRTERV